MPANIRLKRRLCASKINMFFKEHPDTKQVHPNAIKEVMGLYKEWRNCSKLSSIRFSRQVLDYIAECMFHSSFDDGQYIAAFLNYIFDTDKSFQRIIFEYVADSIEQYKLAEYLLHCAYRHKILIQRERIPFTETEILAFAGCNLTILEVAACIYPNPKLLHLMLRYGAIFSFYKECVDPAFIPTDRRLASLPQYSLMPLTWTIIRIYEFNPNFLPTEDFQLEPENIDIYNKLVCNVELLLRDFPLSKPIFAFNKPEIENIVPEYLNYYMTPLKLKAMCRHIIRRTLNEKWLLPRGIYLLPIPETLKLYLDLRCD